VLQVKQESRELKLRWSASWLHCKGAIRWGAKGAEAPSLAKSELRKKIKYRMVLTCFVPQWSEAA